LHGDTDDRAGVEIDGVLSFGEIVEPLLAQQPIQSRVERVTRGRREIGRRDPHGRLSVAFAFTHCHGQSVVRRMGCVDLHDAPKHRRALRDFDAKSRDITDR
jgi:hypothetical protein